MATDLPACINQFPRRCANSVFSLTHHQSSGGRHVQRGSGWGEGDGHQRDGGGPTKARQCVCVRERGLRAKSHLIGDPAEKETIQIQSVDNIAQENRL